ncbi:amino acid adenylation domain-containing protein [Nostoc sp.]|uniref:amino acid adenylation domain-containing protein n=1 Tax=Nostoc sp. TaxID=1180 RepID=UPI002FF9AE0B
MTEELFVFPASFAQQRLWFLDRMTPSSAIYNIPEAIRMRGVLNVKILQQAIEAIVARHEPLRTTFELVNGSPVQIISEKGSIFMPIIDLSELVETDRESEIHEIAAQDACQPFDLTKGPLLRTTLLRLTEKEHVLLVTMHHIISDAWSVGVFIQDLSAFYEAFCAFKPSPLPNLPFQYADFTCWQQEWLQGKVLESQLFYWKQQLAHLPVLHLPTDRKRPIVQTFRGATQSFVLPTDLSASLNTLSRQEGTTLFMTLLAAFQTFLHRYTRQDDIVTGSVIANRNRVETEDLIGFFVNTLVLRTDFSGNPSFCEILARVRHVALEAYAHQDLPFEKLVKELQPERHLSHTPLFQVMFVLQNAPMEELKLPGVSLSPIAVSTNTAKFDLTLEMEETKTGLKGVFEYNTDLFDAVTITQMVGHFQTLLAGIIADPDQHLSKLPLLTATEQHQLLMKWNNTQAKYPQNECIHQLFEAQVERTPDAIALVFEDEQLTYQELNQRANQLAHHLQYLGVGAEMLVGLCVERSLEMVLGILGILKAGGAYIALDPAYPQERLTFILGDTQTPILLTQQRLLEGLPHQVAHLVCLDTDWEAIAQESDENPASGTNVENLAYVIYTSGSTGKPKGVTINHSNVVRLLAATHCWYNFNERDVWTLFHSYAFDFSVWEIWGSLLYGGQLVVVPFWVTRSPDALYELLHSQKVTVLNQTPSAFRQLMHAEEQAETQALELALRLVIFGGEALELKNLSPWFEHHGSEYPQLVNMYGITETTVHATYHPLTENNDVEAALRGSPIGHPISDLQIYLLDGHLNPVPIGVTGEMYVGGPGLARGYLNRPDLSSERFIPNPFSRQPGERMYKTGDLARYLPNGNIEFLGRIDEQVKIRGFRIELGEIEAVLAQHPAVRETVVITREDQPGDKRLVSYVVPHQRQLLNVSELRHFLKQKLPDYMMPSTFVLLEALPLTPNGKVARLALPVPDQARPEFKEAYVAPRNSVEEVLVVIWAEVLGIEKVGIHDNFFALGGDSIRTIQVVARAKERGLNFSLQQLFQHQTICELGQELKMSEVISVFTPQAAPFSLISEQDCQKLPSCVEDAYPMTILQQGMIYHMELTSGLPLYHNVDSFILQARFNLKAFQEAVQRVVHRHAILRTSFDLTTYTEPLQLVHKTAILPIQVEDLRHLAEHEQEEVVARYVKRETKHRFNLSQPPLLRFCIHRRTDERFHLTLTECHAILDGWSLTSTLAEIFKSYSVLLNNKTLPIEPPPTVSFRDFVLQERIALKSEACQRYWTQKLSECTLLSLPHFPDSSTTHSCPHISDWNVSISTEVFEKLKQVAQVAAVPLKSVLLAGHLKVMSLISAKTDILTGLVSNGRSEEVDGEQVRGLFLNTVPFRLKLTGGTWMDLVQETFKTELELLPFRRYPMAALQKNWGDSPLLNTSFNFINFHSLDTFYELDNVELLGLAQSYNPSNFKLAVSFSLTQEVLWPQDNLPLRVLLNFNANELSQEQIKAIGDYYTKTLNKIATNPFARHDSQCLLSSNEQHKLLVKWNNTQTNYPRNIYIHQLFEAQVEQTPNAVAVIFEDKHLTYLELNHRANQLAHYLQALGVGPEVLVGICIERSLDMMVGLLGILKAGGVYVPLDPAYPEERLTYILNDSYVSVLLTQQKLLARLPKSGVQVISLDTDWGNISQESQANTNSKIQPENLAYVIYTSGSTGQPKGVAIQQKSILNYSNSILENLNIGSSRNFALVSTISADLGHTIIFPALCTGGSLHVLSQEQASNPDAFADYLNRHSIDCLKIVPSHLAALQTSSTLKLVLPRQLLILGGEASHTDWVESIQALAPECTILNHYGPTETTVGALTYLVEKHSLAPQYSTLPLGRPIANTQIYILDHSLQPVPIGVVGELHIGGTGLARGYLNRPDLTALKFIPNPFSKQEGARLYKTGDLARYLPDGNIEFLGRLDDQVKIRGFRIELGEIEAILASHPAVRKTIVIAREDQLGDKRLVAYIVPNQDQPSIGELRKFLKQKLPEYMIPNALVILDALPLTPNGKINRHALPASNTELSLEAGFITPRDTLELQLAQIWSDVLGIHPIGVQDNFFDLGGHSLLAVRLMAQIQQYFGKSLPLATLFQGTTIEKLASLLHSSTDFQLDFPLVTIQSSGSKSPFFCIHPIGGNVLCYADLARCLTSEQPVYGLQSLGLNGKQEPLTRIEDMAAHYIEALLTIQPQGPYQLGGWSLGGVVAFEMAQQLHSSGQEVALLALIDSYAPMAIDMPEQMSEAMLVTSLTKDLSGLFGKELPVSNQPQQLQTEKQLIHILEQAKMLNILPPFVGIQQMRQMLQVFKANSHALSRYRPQPYSGRIILFCANKKVEEDTQNKSLGWGELAAGGIEVHQIGGDHYAIIREPYVQVLAERLEIYLNQTGKK